MRWFLMLFLLSMGCQERAAKSGLLQNVEPVEGRNQQSVQAAIDEACRNSGGIVQLEAGEYLIGHRGDAGVADIASLRVECANLQIRGRGPHTRLVMVGNAQFKNWNLLQISGGAHNVSVSDLTLSGELATNTAEQTHVIQVGPGARDIRLSNLWFFHPQRGTEAGGDCIRLIGDHANPVEGTTISLSTFTSCDRSGVSMQRHVYSTDISHNLFLDVGDQHIDQEPSGAGSIGRTVITGNVMYGGSQGDFSVALVGNGMDDPSRDIVFSSNILVGRGVLLMNVADVTMVGNTIAAQPRSAAGVVHGRRDTRGVKLSDNTITRMSGSAPGAVVVAAHNNGGFPSNWTVTGNTLNNYVDGDGASLDSTLGALISQNIISLHPTELGTYSGVRLAALSGKLDGVLVTGNRVTGSAEAVVAVSAAAGQELGQVSVVGNLANGSKFGVICKGAGVYSQPITHSSYNYLGATAAEACPVGRMEHQAP